jgi:predicted nucleic acid-binding Zn ribbon protein
MPTYVYKFIDTGETIEVQQAFTDDALTHAKHPVTGKKLKVKKVFTPVGVSFRGGGFYKTDSRGGKSKSSSNGSTSTESSSSSSSDTKSSGDSSTAAATPAAAPAKPAKSASKTTSSSD